jgi:hypothetical protein
MLPVVAALEAEELRLGVTGVIALLLLAVDPGVTVAGPVPAGGGGAVGALAGAGCVPAPSSRVANGESVCWPPVLACDRGAGSAGVLLTSDMILGALDTAALPGDGYSPFACNPRASADGRRNARQFKGLSAKAAPCLRRKAALPGKYCRPVVRRLALAAGCCVRAAAAA